MEDSLIWTLGCWHLAAFRWCIRVPEWLPASTAMLLLCWHHDNWRRCYWSVGWVCLRGRWAVMLGWTHTGCRLY